MGWVVFLATCISSRMKMLRKMQKINGILRFRNALNVIGFFVMHHAWLLNPDFRIKFCRIFLVWNYQQKTNFVYEVASTFVKNTMKIAGTVFP